VQVYESLRDRIASGALPAGTVLNMGLIADDHDVSRPTVAHALRVLEEDGKVRRYPGVGWQVD
jgi:DNA-binding GntR family transcriptional regulator